MDLNRLTPPLGLLGTARARWAAALAIPVVIGVLAAITYSFWFGWADFYPQTEVFK